MVPHLPVFGFVDKKLVIAEFDVRKLHHDFTELITRAILQVDAVQHP